MVLRNYGITVIKKCLEINNPYYCVRDSISLYNNVLNVVGSDGTSIKSYENPGTIYVVGCGKASYAMSSGAESVLGKKVQSGIIVTKYNHKSAVPLQSCELIEAGHPIPDENGLFGTKKVCELLNSARENDLIIALISGGGSALWPFPVDGVTLEDLQKVSEHLLECGAAIHEFNAIRKHLSRIHGGQAARLAFPAQVLVLVLSDVIGNNLDTIASGPFFPDSSTFTETMNILKKYELMDLLPLNAVNFLISCTEGLIPETPKVDEICFANVFHHILADNQKFIHSIKNEISRQGIMCIVNEKSISGEASTAAKAFAQSIKESLSKYGVDHPLCIVSGGETTVTLNNEFGKGGRNQEFALAAACEIGDLQDCTIFSFGTDGNDGPTDAAGGIVDEQFIRRCNDKGFIIEEYLRKHDSYNLLNSMDALIVTGPTLTNLMDVQIAFVNCRNAIH
jgi:hydroxypyruvate reductase